MRTKTKYKRSNKTQRRNCSWSIYVSTANQINSLFQSSNANVSAAFMKTQTKYQRLNKHYLIFSAVFNELTLTALLMSFFSILLNMLLLQSHAGLDSASHPICSFF